MFAVTPDPELNHLRDYGDLSLHQPWEKKGDLIKMSWLWWPHGLGCSVGSHRRLPNRSGHVAQARTSTQAGRDVLFIKCVSSDLIPPQPSRTQIHTLTNTQERSVKDTCVYRSLVRAVCFTWLMIAQAVREAERLCWKGLAACRARLRLLSGLGSASA